MVLLETPVGGREPDDLAVYARRRTRMAFLRLMWGAEHPIVGTESCLVRMASSKLRETLLVRHGEDGLTGARPAVEMSVLASMRSFVPSFALSPEGREALYAALNSETFEDLFRGRGH